jgi:hypothetical protein
MIKLGDAILDEISIEAIKPTRINDSIGGGVEFEGLVVYLSHGVQVLVRATMDEATEVLQRVGCLAVEPDAVSMVFTSDELQKLRDALKSGFYYAAKESTGQVFAYSCKPIKGEATWIGSIDSEVMRLKGEFPMLSFEDDEPLDIMAATGKQVET